jgi:hypothetical protein
MAARVDQCISAIITQDVLTSVDEYEPSAEDITLRFALRNDILKAWALFSRSEPKTRPLYHLTNTVQVLHLQEYRETRFRPNFMGPNLVPSYGVKRIITVTCLSVIQIESEKRWPQRE